MSSLPGGPGRPACSRPWPALRMRACVAPGSPSAATAATWATAAYGERWVCPKCGRRLEHRQIPADEYWGIMRDHAPDAAHRARLALAITVPIAALGALPRHPDPACASGLMGFWSCSTCRAGAAGCGSRPETCASGNCAQSELICRCVQRRRPQAPACPAARRDARCCWPPSTSRSITMPWCSRSTRRWKWGRGSIVANVVERAPLPLSAIMGYDDLPYPPEMAESLAEAGAGWPARSGSR